MDAMEAVFNRRSIRKYSKRTIDEKIINQLLDAGFCAPSAGNQQPWHFIIVNERRILNEITSFHPNASMLKNADKAIVVCGDLDLEKYKGYWMLDCSAATENILIAAKALGIGACWLGIYPRNERISKMKAFIGIPKNIVPMSLISLGYPGEHKLKENRFNKSRIHYNMW